MAKNPKKTKEAEVLDEKAVRELEELKRRLRAETSADMVVLRALMDAERQARGIEQAASDYAVGAEWRVAEAAREIDARERANAVPPPRKPRRRPPKRPTRRSPGYMPTPSAAAPR